MSHQTDTQLAPELRTTLTRLVKKLRNKSTTVGQLSLTERSTLALLDANIELSPTDIAGMEKITTQSMSQILNHLLELGHINRRLSATDKRKSIITLTKSGRDTLYKVRNERDEWLNQAVAETCSVKDQELLRRSITLLQRLIDYD